MCGKGESGGFASAIAAAALLLAALTHPARADIIHVYPGESIQDAIDGCSNGDEIIVHPGTYNEAIDFIGKSIIVRSSDGPDVTTLSGPGPGVTFANGESGAMLQGFSIAACSPRGFFISNGSAPLIIDCILTGNTSGGTGAGGAMLVDAGHLTLLNCSLHNNTAWMEMPGGPGSSGGAVFLVDGSLLALDCVFTDNWAGGGYSSPSSGGAIRSVDSDVVLTDCVFQGNSVDGSMYEGGQGGAIRSSGSSLTLTNCIFQGNSAALGGYVSARGGAVLTSSSTILTNCTFYDNIAHGGGPEPGEGGALSGGAMVSNCIFWNDHPYEIHGSPDVQYSNVQGGWSGAGNIDADPLFVDPTNGDYRLSPGSPCIDAGDSDAVPPGITTDLDGNPRFVDDPDTPDTGVGYPCVDMGAYEFQVASPCPADINGDNMVNVLDLLLVLAAWGNTSGPEDINGDGIVNVLDILEILAAWGPCAAPC